jgi:CHAT domain-containing protein
MTSSVHSRFRRWAGSGALLGVTALAALFFVHHPSTLRQELLATSGACRPTPGRLTGEKQYRPWHKERCAGTDQKELRSQERAVGSRWRGNSDSDRLDVALYSALGGRTSGAIANFELAAREPPTAVSALTDLSALYLLRFEAEQDPLDLLRAVQAADRGLARAPALPSLLFNRAQALSALGTRALAVRAWQDILDQESSPGWRQEAATHLRELRKPSDEERWTRSLLILESPAATTGQVITLTESLPANARSYAEEILLPQWASAFSRGDALRAGTLLQRATAIGETLERTHGEALLVDALAALHETLDHGTPAQREALLRGLQAFGVGAAHYQKQNLTSARKPLSQAARDLGSIGCPLSFWARFYLAIGEYYENATRGLALFDALLAEIPQDRYLALTGRVEWLAGTADKVQGRIQSSVRRYERAQAALRRSGGDAASAFVAVLLAESYSLLGEHSLAWQQRLLAFRQVPFSEGPRRNIAMWGEAKEALLRNGHFDLAGPLVDEAVAEADRWGLPLGRVSAYTNRAAWRLDFGTRQQALEDLREARQSLSQMEESGLKEQLAVITAITEGLFYEKTDPARSASLFEAALEGQDATENRFEAITYTTEKAAAQLTAGDLSAGAASLEEAISLFEDIRTTVEDPVSRMQAFRQAQPAFDRLIDLRMTRLTPDPDEAFLLAERSRARVLLELRTGNGSRAARGPDFVRLSDLATALPREATLVSYAVLEDRVLAWIIEGGRSRLVTLDIPRKDLARAIERFRLEMKREAAEADLQKVAAPLYDSLIRPLALAPGNEGPLIIAPDRWLARLPFSALFDRATGRYLIEQRIVTIVPSATLLVQGARARRTVEANAPSALTVGVSRSGSFSGRLLRSLPHAEKEAQAIAKIYQRSQELLGADATKGNFLRLSVSSDVVHFAGHAVVDLESPRRSVLLFAGASGALEPLSLGELFDAGVGGASLVVLSACRAQDSLVDDREGLLGIAGAFFAAGVPEVVASPWDVDDRSSLPVMVAFHREYLKHRSAGIAFRQAVLELRRSGAPEDRSPAAWGGFTVIAGTLDEGGM